MSRLNCMVGDWGVGVWRDIYWDRVDYKD